MPGERRGGWAARVGGGATSAALAALYGLFAALPLDAASALGAAAGRRIGPRLGRSRVALDAIRRALPDRPEAEHRRILLGMWDNLGRVVAEYPHLRRMGRAGRIETEGFDRLAGRSGPVLILAGHFANWEVLAPALAQAGLPFAAVFRPPNNPMADRLVRRSRLVPGATFLAKGHGGARGAARWLRQGGLLTLLVDQKLNSGGVAVPFLGRPAMTAPAIAAFARRFGCPIVPVRVVRLAGARFRVVAEAPLAVEGDDRRMLARVNQVLERWVRDAPEQWLWLHRRWDPPSRP